MDIFKGIHGGDDDKKKNGCGLQNAKSDNPDVSSGKTEKTVRFDKEGFEVTFDYPATYQEIAMPDEDPTSVVYRIGEENASFNIVVEKLPLEMTLNEYVEASLTQFKKDGAEILNSKNFTLNGLTFNETISNFKGLRLKQATILHNGNAYIFTYASPSAIFGKYVGGYDQLLTTIKIKS